MTIKFKALLSASLVTTCMLTTNLAFSQSAEDLKAQSLQICDAQVNQLPEEQRETVSAICTCTVENTDYEQLLKNSQEGNITKVQEDAAKVAEQCQKDLL